MNIDDAHGWEFVPPLQERSEIQCCECGAWSALSRWDVDSVPCETCGDHDAIVCPACGEEYDYVYDKKPFSTRVPA